MDNTIIPSADLPAQAQAGNVWAIAALLSRAIPDPPIRFEVSCRDRTLYIFLTVSPPALPADYAPAVYRAIAPLQLDDIDQLCILDGTDLPLVERWQQSRSLDPQGEPVVADPPPPLELVAVLGSAPPSSPRPSERERNRPTPRLSLSPPAASPTFPGLPWLEPLRLPRQWRLLSLLMAIGLGLGVGVAQWRYGQPLTSTAAVAGAPTLTPLFPANRSVALVPTALQATTTLTINAVGDIIPGTDYQRYRLPADWQYLFRSIQHQLADADLTFGNFESTLTEVPRSAKDTSRAMTFAFRTPPWYASVLKEAGFDVLSVANNHSFDFGEQGFAETISHIEAAGMRAVGRKDEILYVNVNETTVAFIAFSHLSGHNTVHDLNAAAALVQTAKAQADLVVVSFHAGKEGTDAIYTRDQTEYFFSENRGNVVQFSRTVIDHGADLVLGHGPHVPRALELYNNKLIAYSLGNFLGYRTLSTVGPLGVSLILQTHLNTQGDFISGRIIPVALDPNGVPYLDDHFQSVILLRNYTRRDFPQTPLEIDDMGYVWRSEP